MSNKSKKQILGIMGMALAYGAMSDPLVTGLTGIVGESKPIPKIPKPLIPYYKQEGIAKMIVQYNAIIKGTCTLGKRKQARVIEKVEAMLASKMISLTHINYK